jgi:CubicO group peptidase (beta-lactamase class C family)
VGVWPGREWKRGDPTALGIDAELLASARAGALARQTDDPRDMAQYLGAILASQSHPEVIGPLRDGNGASGVVVHRGYVVAEWGDPAAVEMSFSATKSYLSVVAGLAVDRRLITDLNEAVAVSVDAEAFAEFPSSAVTWDHLLRQTSQWAGTLWSKPWWSDPQGGQARDTVLGAPGSGFAYNDVRVNLLALALTLLWRRSLADVLRTEVMDPIGASDSWQWHGYDNSWVEIDGRQVAVVSGGAHWGGGLWMSALDHARLGYLFLRRGWWREQPVISEQWVDASTTAAATNPDYGMLSWLNRHGRVFGRAPTTGFCARGNAGRQLVWIDPARDLVVVSRWSDNVGKLLAEVSNAVGSESR